jgi:hypothetical protein
MKGSNKPRLNAYAQQVALYCKISLNVTWIPRDLNKVADAVSRFLDTEDYGITEVAFIDICRTFNMMQVHDLFAHTDNTKTAKFFSGYGCPDTGGIDAFNYDWGN